MPPAVRPASREESSGNERRSTLLNRTIETEIIPRLILSGRAAAAAVSVALARDLSDDVIEFSRLVLVSDEATAIAYVMHQCASGLDVQTIFVDLLAPAARRLGTMWEDDTLSFADVTIGLGRLQRVLHELSRKFEAECGPSDLDRRILLVPGGREQHTFGLSMLSEIFRQAHWDVTVERPVSRQELCRLVRLEWFAVVGFSVSLTESIDTLAPEIRAVRKASRNKSIGVMVGGPAFLRQPERVAMVGADATAIDGRHAVVQAQDLLALLPRRT